MSEVIVIAHLQAAPEKQDELAQVLTDLVTASHDDPGCVLYALHQATEDPTQFAFVERWSSPEDLQGHNGTPHMAAALGKAGALLGAPPQIVTYAPLPAGDAAKGTLAGS